MAKEQDFTIYDRLSNFNKGIISSLIHDSYGGSRYLIIGISTLMMLIVGVLFSLNGIGFRRSNMSGIVRLSDGAYVYDDLTTRSMTQEEGRYYLTYGLKINRKYILDQKSFDSSLEILDNDLISYSKDQVEIRGFSSENSVNIGASKLVKENILTANSWNVLNPRLNLKEIK